MKTLLVGALALFVTTLASCTPPSETSGDTIIAARNAAFAQAFAAGDGTAVAAMYADGAIVMPDGASPVQGREAIMQFWQGFIDSGAARLELMTDETISAGSTTISERGRFRIFDAAGASIAEGKYVVVWTLEGGEWMLRWDIWNANAGPAPAG
ncbi:YybH family protein [Terricaulis silvestris]|uniref:SnoaL-like domain protein n=1 Tax=Terricaulis silvestris TaxID=2686094 RepID=A0A6I6MK78_9CAUL|nr:nuclear transport factor 2 family protein [Terricaulis silvestris]QGZ93354.1 SnoaL-like domain protein [Terricaulis silvestris]